MKIVGDMSIRDLTPKSTNIGDRIVKNMRICGSGIYTYACSEAPLLHLDPVPEKYNDLQFINVYRPPEVLEKYKDYFARIPIITGHHIKIDRENAKKFVVGMIGDTIESEVDKEDGETYLYATGTIVAGDGVDAYEQYGQLSCGYDPVIEWEEGEHNGTPYQAVLRKFNDVNHLLICKVARGGPQCMVMDSLDYSDISPLEKFVSTHNGGKDMGIFSKIFGSVKKSIVGDAAVVSALLQSIAAGADPEIQVQKVRDIVGDSDEVFNGYLDELSKAKSEKPEIISRAVDIVDGYYRSHLAGDEEKKEEKKEPEEKKEEKKEPEEKKEEKKEPAGDEEEKCSKCGKHPCECNKSAGDAIDYDLLAEKVAAKLKKEPETEKQIGDEYSMTMNGDSNKETRGSDEFMKEMFGR